MATRRTHLYESATFWALLGGAIAVIGLGLMAIGVTQEVASRQSDLWANWWFRIGFALLVVGAAMLIWAVILFLASRRPPDSGSLTPTPPTPGNPPAASFTIGKSGDINVYPPTPPTAPVPFPTRPSETVHKGFDPNASYFSYQTIRITDFPLQDGIYLRGKTFENCIIEGPAILAVRESVEFIEVTFEGASPNNLVWTAPSPSDPLDCVIVLEADAFRKCRMRRIGLLVSPELVQDVRDAATGKRHRLDLGRRGKASGPTQEPSEESGPSTASTADHD
jgi:hypothetical protein